VARKSEIPMFGAKCLMGRNFADPSVQSEFKFWPFKCATGQGDKPMTALASQSNEKKCRTEEIKNEAPAYFNEATSGSKGCRRHFRAECVPLHSRAKYSCRRLQLRSDMCSSMPISIRYRPHLEAECRPLHTRADSTRHCTAHGTLMSFLLLELEPDMYRRCM